jgi:anti-sigma regulatory factor (Ser/Thr protein kinase)
MTVRVRGFHHAALLYRGSDDYVAAVTTFVRRAAEQSEPVLVAVPGTNLDLLRGALTGLGDRVNFADMTVAGRNPGRILPSVLLRFVAEHPGRHVSIVGEPIWRDRTEVEYPACAAHEALINVAFAGRDAAILCPYDTRQLDPSVITDASFTHPALIEDGVRRDSDRYAGPGAVAAAFNRPLPPPPPDAESLEYRQTLAAVRCFVRRHAAAHLPEDRVEQLVLAASEVAANTVEHTARPGRVTVWTEPGIVVCQLQDAGHLTDPLAGRIVPPRIGHRGFGLVLTNELCDLVRIHSTPSGTAIRLHKLR